MYLYVDPSTFAPFANARAASRNLVSRGRDGRVITLALPHGRVITGYYPQGIATHVAPARMQLGRKRQERTTEEEGDSVAGGSLYGYVAAVHP